MKKLLLIGLMICFSTKIWAQASTFINTTFNINAGVPVTWYGDVTFGPNAVVYIEDGATAIFYGKNMTVDPAAQFICLPSNGQTGTGVFIFKSNNPLHQDYPLQQTLNGGYTSGNNPSLPNIEIDNPDGVSLSGNTRITNTVNFKSGHIYLNNFNLVLDNDASFIGNSVTKHVVTNGTGVIVKENLAAGASFLFPVSIAGIDYTPATVTNTAAARNINVQVKDYATSAAVESTFATKGMERTWQITSNIAGNATVALQHNSANNANGSGTNESAFNNSLAFVSQQLSTGVWSQSCTGTDGGSPISINTGTNFNLSTAVNATAFFTKKTVGCTDLMVTKTVNNAMPVVGSNLTFTIVVKNNGVADATGVLVKDLLPSGYTFVGSNVTSGAYNSATGDWTVGNLANGASATLTVTARVNAAGVYANTATITGTETDPDPANNSSTVTPIPGAIQANLGVVKTVDIAAPTIGNNVVFTIAVNNAGPNDATNVKVADILAAGYTYVNSTVTRGTFDAPSGTWTIGNFTNGATATMTITAKVNAVGPYSNTATIAGAEADPVPGNNSSTITTVPNAAMVNLSIVKTADLKPTSIGEEFDYLITVKNIGANLATGAIASDILPAGLTYVSSQTAYGTASYNASNRTVSWSIGNLAVDATVTMTIKVKTDVAGIYANTATAASAEQDVDMSNNTSTVGKEIFGLRMPNVITPDGDGLNDALKIPGLKAYPENTMAVFNRWGNEVWRSNGAYQENWTGEGLNEGTYYYMLRLKDKTGKWQTFIRWVTLLKD